MGGSREEKMTAKVAKINAIIRRNISLIRTKIIPLLGYSATEGRVIQDDIWEEILNLHLKSQMF